VPIPADRTHFEALLKYYAGEKNWERYFFLKNTFVDLRPRDAATVHKSQGSTYDAVFIDLGNISTCNIKDQAARMLYVAFSRARTRVFIYGNLVAKYGGLIS
jgi:ATP-dependent exoDNAse (exonuclease V) alpha subunit